MRYPYFFARDDECWEDSWTYGDHRQYICNRSNGQTQCARFSGLPIFGLMAGVVLSTWVFCLIGVAFYAETLDVNWPVVLGLLALSALLVTPYVLGRVYRTYLMKAVGPMNDGARRVLPWDKENGR